MRSRKSGALRLHCAPKHGSKDARAGFKRRDKQRALRELQVSHLGRFRCWRQTDKGLE